MENLKERIAAFQKDSWQLEVFISGGIVFWLFAVTDDFQALFFEIYPLSFFTSNQIILLFGAYTITRALLIGFAANLLLRAIWLAYLGLNYWYPKGLNKERLPDNVALSNRIMKSKTANERVLILERWCNLSFSFAVIFALFGFSLVVIMSGIMWVFLAITGQNFLDNSWVTYGILLILILLQLGILDNLFYSKGKPDSKWSKFRNGLSRFLDIITLSFLFKREFLVLRTNAKPWFIYILSTVYLGLALLISINQIGEYYPFGTFNVDLFDERTQYSLGQASSINGVRYESNLKPGGVSFYGCIQSDIIEDDYLKLFVVSWVNFDDYLKQRFQHHGFSTTVPRLDSPEAYDTFYKKNDSLYQRVLNDLFTVKIDDQIFPDLTWRETVNAVTKEEGYVTYIPIELLNNKEHMLILERSYLDYDGKARKSRWMTIPFYTQD